MSIRFRKRVKLLPGVYVNIGKRGITSTSLGVRGASVTVGKKTRVTASIPGSGISTSSVVGGRSEKATPISSVDASPSTATGAFIRAVAAWLLALAVVHSMLTGLSFWLLKDETARAVAIVCGLLASLTLATVFAGRVYRRSRAGASASCPAKNVGLGNRNVRTTHGPDEVR